MTKRERLEIFKENLLKAAMPRNPKEAIALINRTLDAVEELYCNDDTDRMYGVLDDKYVTYYEDGRVVALTTKNIIEVEANGSFAIYFKKSLFLRRLK